MRKTHFTDGQFIPQPHPSDGRFVDRTGMKSPDGKLEILFYLGKVSGGHYWCAQCACGEKTAVLIANVETGATSSCGCHKIAMAGSHNLKHGKSDTDEFNIWRGITKRCTNPKIKQWHRYGGRGIVMCERWHNFANFLADVGQRPSKQHQIDRIDNDGNYSCGKCPQCIANGWTANCKWSTRKEQCRNTRRTRMIQFHGESRCLQDWANILQVDRMAITRCLRKGMTVEEAFARITENRAQRSGLSGSANASGRPG